MAFYLTAASLAAIAIASPLTRRSPLETSVSKGFHLIANVNSPRDLVPPINGWTLGSLNDVANKGRAVLVPGPASSQLTFYQNGTEDDVNYRHARLAYDRDVWPAGLQLDYSEPSSFLHAAWLRPGPGSIGMMLGDDREPYPFLDPLQYSGTPNSFIACKEVVTASAEPAGTGLSWDKTPGIPETHVTVAFLTGYVDISGDAVLVVPDNCVDINLVPQCAVLANLPEWVAGNPELVSHKYAQDSRCFDDVSSVVWGS